MFGWLKSLFSKPEPKPVVVVKTVENRPLVLVDISHHNVDNYGAVDFAGLKRNGVVGVICKSGEGASNKDSTMVDNIYGALQVGLEAGIYHFFRANVDAKAQADNFNSRLALLKSKGLQLTLPNTVDAETTDKQSSQAIRDGVTKFMDLVEGKEILYTGDAFFEENVFSKIKTSFIRWIARYGSTKPKTPDVKMWQYTETGSFPGVVGRFDINYFYGTLEELKSLKD